MEINLLQRKGQWSRSCYMNLKWQPSRFIMTRGIPCAHYHEINMHNPSVLLKKEGKKKKHKLQHSDKQNHKTLVTKLLWSQSFTLTNSHLSWQLNHNSEVHNSLNLTSCRNMCPEPKKNTHHSSKCTGIEH